jgi:NAD+ synthase
MNARMTEQLRISLAQINPTVGDIAGNTVLIRDARRHAALSGADLVLLSELVITGYPPEDLVLKAAFQDHVEREMVILAKETADGGPGVLVGAPWRVDNKLFNAVLLLDGGEIAAVRLKHELPNYGVFDEKRVFAAGPCPGPIAFRGVRLGVMICEDMWFQDVAETLQESGAEILLVPNGSPFEWEKRDERLNHAIARVVETGLPLIYVNQVGGQDELVFDGGSFVLGADRSLLLQFPSWRPAQTTTTWNRGSDGVWVCVPGEIASIEPPMEAIYRAMVLGLHDYVEKNGFPGVVLGLSGGIDSAISAAIAVDALGADKVRCVMMPSPYTSTESLEDATEIAHLLGTTIDTIAIGPAMQAFDGMLSAAFAGAAQDTTEENIQARSRAVILMAMSNKLGTMLLTTGNKSEMSVGYATLYGDMCGGYSVLKDVYKTMVFALCNWRNQATVTDMFGPDGPVMPGRVITKPPSAELRLDQKDQDSLPPYDVLDDILHCLIEEELSLENTVAKGHDQKLVRRIWGMLDRAEYKRRQAPPGVKITDRAFGRDRRYPITNGFTRLV